MWLMDNINMKIDTFLILIQVLDDEKKEMQISA
jgi:hypothetical protein